MIFFLFMFVSFSTTRVIIEKNKFREEQIDGLSLTHEPSIKDLDHISSGNFTEIEEFGKLIFSVWGTMIRGDFDNDANEYPGFYIRFCGVCVVFLANVILLNLLVAVLGDAYDQVNSNQNELLLMREKFLILRQDAFF